MFRQSRLDAFTPPMQEVSRVSQLSHAERMEKIRMKRAQEQEEALKTLEEHEQKRKQAELNRQKAIKERSLSAHSTMAKVEDAKKRKAELEAVKKRRLEEARRRNESSHTALSHHQEKPRIAFGTTAERDLAYLGVPKKYAALNVPLKADPLSKEEENELKRSSPITSKDGIYERRTTKTRPNIAFGTSMTRSVHGALGQTQPRTRSTASKSTRTTTVVNSRARSNAPMTRSVFGGTLSNNNDQMTRSFTTIRPPVSSSENKNVRKPPLPPVQRLKIRAESRAQNNTPAPNKIIRAKEAVKKNAIKSPPSTPPDYKKAKSSNVEALPQPPIDQLNARKDEQMTRKASIEDVTPHLLKFTELSPPIDIIISQPTQSDILQTPQSQESILPDSAQADIIPRMDKVPDDTPIIIDYTEVMGENMPQLSHVEKEKLIDWPTSTTETSQHTVIEHKEPVPELDFSGLIHSPEELLSGLLHSSGKSPRRQSKKDDELRHLPEVHMTIDDGIKATSSQNEQLSPAGTYTVSNESEDDASDEKVVDSDAENRDNSDTLRITNNQLMPKVSSLAEMQINDEKFLQEKERRVQEIERKRIADEQARQERLNKLRQTLARVDKTKTADSSMSTSMFNGSSVTPTSNGNMALSMILPGQVALNKSSPNAEPESMYSTPIAQPVAPQRQLATPASLYSTPAASSEGGRPSILQSNPRLQALMKKHLKETPVEKEEKAPTSLEIKINGLGPHIEETTPNKTPTSPMDQMSLEEELARANNAEFCVSHQFEDN